MRSVSLKVANEQQNVIFWSLMHVFTVVGFFTGLYYCREYMMMPDRVVIMDKGGNLFQGTSRDVICRDTVHNIAERAAMAFLDRSFEHNNQKTCEALFGKTAQKSLRDIISRSSNEFTEQKIRQTPVIKEIEITSAGEPDQCLAFVSGILHRTGIYMNIPYYQELEFTLGLRLMRSPDIKTYPLRVLRMVYGEKSIYDNKTRKE